MNIIIITTLSFIMLFLIFLYIVSRDQKRSEATRTLKMIEKQEGSSTIYRVESSQYGILSEWHDNSIDAWIEGVKQVDKMV